MCAAVAAAGAGGVEKLGSAKGGGMGWMLEGDTRREMSDVTPAGC